MKLVLIYDVLKIIITILRRDSKDSCDQKHCVHIVPRRAFRKMAMGASSRWIYSFVIWHNKRLTQLVRLSKKIGWSGLILYRQQTRVSQSWVWLRLTLPFTASNIIVNKSASRRIPWNPAVTMFFFFFLNELLTSMLLSAYYFEQKIHGPVIFRRTIPCDIAEWMHVRDQKVHDIVSASGVGGSTGADIFSDP